MAILSIPVLFIRHEYPQFEVFNILIFFYYYSSSFISYWFPIKASTVAVAKNFIQYVGLFITFYTIAMGFSFHNSVAVLEGLWGKKVNLYELPN
jgi:hypothetical protein